MKKHLSPTCPNLFSFNSWAVQTANLDKQSDFTLNSIETRQLWSLSCLYLGLLDCSFKNIDRKGEEGWRENDWTRPPRRCQNGDLMPHADIGVGGDCGWQPNVNVSGEEAGRGGHVVPALPRSLGPARLSDPHCSSGALSPPAGLQHCPGRATLQSGLQLCGRRSPLYLRTAAAASKPARRILQHNSFGGADPSRETGTCSRRVIAIQGRPSPIKAKIRI